MREAAEKRGATRRERPERVSGHDIVAAVVAREGPGEGTPRTSEGKEETMRRILPRVWVAVIAVAVAILSVTAAAPAGGSPRYLDQKASIHNRVNDLLHRMTVQEKVGQMDQQLVDDVTGPSNACGTQGWAQLNPSCLRTSSTGG